MDYLRRIIARCPALVAQYSVLPSGLYWAYGDGDWRQSVGADFASERGRHLTHFLDFASPARRGSKNIDEELAGGSLETRIGQLRQFAGLQSMAGVLGMGSGRRRVFVGLNMRGGGGHHQRDNLHMLIWANGAELYPDQSASYKGGFRQMGREPWAHNLVTVFEEGGQPSRTAYKNNGAMADGVNYKSTRVVPGIGSRPFSEPWANAYVPEEKEAAPVQLDVYGPIQLLQVDQPTAFEATLGAGGQYRRLLAVVQGWAGGSPYVLEVTHVKGGARHDYGIAGNGAFDYKFTIKHQDGSAFELHPGAAANDNVEAYNALSGVVGEPENGHTTCPGLDKPDGQLWMTGQRAATVPAGESVSWTTQSESRAPEVQRFGGTLWFYKEDTCKGDKLHRYISRRAAPVARGQRTARSAVQRASHDFPDPTHWLID